MSLATGGGTGNPVDREIARPFQEVVQSAAPIVSMIEFKGRVLVATTDGVYELKDKVLVPLQFELVE